MLACGLLAIVAIASAVADDNKIAVPSMPDLIVEVGQTVAIQSDAWYPVVFQFADGRISVGWGNYAPKAGRWSSDAGRTWQDGPAPPDEASIELGNGEVLSLGFQMKKRADGKYDLPQRRSLDGWKTVAEETAVVDIPEAVACGGDDGGTNEGFLMDHGILRLSDGRLMATLYGNYGDDKTLADGYPTHFNCRKYRTIVAFSNDKGKTWADPIVVATATTLPQTHEGPCEADLLRAANGDILCAVRAGGRPGDAGPSYLLRSSDEGRTWGKPVELLDRGVWPNLLRMSNGILVAATGRQGDWLAFSSDDGRTWPHAFCFLDGPYPSTSSYNTVMEVAPDTILVVYDRAVGHDQAAPHHEIVGTFFTVRRK